MREASQKRKKTFAKKKEKKPLSSKKEEKTRTEKKKCLAVIGGGFSRFAQA